MALTILAFIVILGFLVFIHELGHFIAAKKFGIGVEEFAIGFPPRLMTRRHNGTDYSINAIPLGGYVKIKGEDGEYTDQPDSFGAKPVWQRMCVMVAGVGMNLLAAWILLVGLFMVGAPIELDSRINPSYIKERSLAVSEVLKDSPAKAAGIQLDDAIISINNTPVTNIDAFQQQTTDSIGTPLAISIRRGKETISLSMVPQIMESIADDRPIIGVTLTELGVVRFPPHKAVIAGTQSAYHYLVRIAQAFGGIIKNVATGNGVGDSIGGPVAIAVATENVVDLGFIHVIIFTAILSINLAIINILPFPALDGGRLIFLILERIRGKASRADMEAWFHRAGFALLMLFAAFITYKDIARFGGGIWHAIVG